MAKKGGREAVHVGIDYAEAHSSKKQILLCETGLLEIIKLIGAYNILRKREFVLKQRMKNSLADIRNVVGEIESELPATEETGIQIEEPGSEPAEFKKLSEVEKIERFRKRTATKEKNRKIEEELEDIKMQLKALE